MRRSTVLVLMAAALFLAATPALAGKGGSHGNSFAAAACTASGDLVQATGLPTDQVINFMMSNGSTTSGWVLGFTSDGTWNVSVPSPSGPTTYEFASRTWGPSGSKYTVFASCTS
jgi:hypothetical protein